MKLFDWEAEMKQYKWRGGGGWLGCCANQG